MKLSEMIKNEIIPFKSRKNIYNEESNYRTGRIDGFEYLLPKIIKLEEENEKMKCCENCKHNGRSVNPYIAPCVDFIFSKCKNNSGWELK